MDISVAGQGAGAADPAEGWDLADGPGTATAMPGAKRAVKRTMDASLALVALLALLPLLGLVALAIRLESPGPALFRQRRVGMDGRVFWMLKFRSMRADAADAGGARQTGRGDPRVTRVGRFIRRTSLDELPQLVNVLNGTMSVVGPRPHPLEMRVEGIELDAAAPGYALRHRVKPGITGWAQINGSRGEIATVEQLRRRVALDLEYARRWSPLLDAFIIARTALKLLGDRDAY